MLVARDLWVTPPGAPEPAVRALSIAVGPGEWVALLGRNGVGKTSALLALGGFWPATGGVLELDGRPFGSRVPGSDRGPISVVFQDPAMQLVQGTVEAEIALGPRNLGVPSAEIEKRVRHWAGRLGIEDELNRDPRMLSAGRQQAVLLAAALATAPRVLLADEPCAFMDESARARVLEVVGERVRSGLAVVWATQSEDERRAAHRSVTLEDGETPRAPIDDPSIPQGTPREAIVTFGVRPEWRPGGPRIHAGSRLEHTVHAGRLSAVLGANGTGKSVLLSALAGLAPCDQVEARWIVNRDSPPLLSLQYPEMQICEEQAGDEIVFSMVARGIPRKEAGEKAEAALALLGRDPRWLDRSSWSLSSGERRLLAAVGALLAPASLVLLDEPTAGLDPEGRLGLARLVASRLQSGAVMVASQDPDWVEALGADRFELGSEGSRIEAKNIGEKPYRTALVS